MRDETVPAAHGSFGGACWVAAWMGIGLAFAAPAARAAGARPGPTADGPVASAPVTPISSAPLASLPVLGPYAGEPKEARPRRKPAHAVPAPGWKDDATATDPLAARGVNSSRRTPSPTLNVDGSPNQCGCSPPDTIGAAGPSHYVQMVNATAVQIFDKAGTSVSGPSQIGLLWPVGSSCRNSSNGDPVAVYDGMANRWLLAQFSTGNGVCVAVSQTGDPTGTYFLYEFLTPDFPDYFKIGAWSNAYYMSANETNYSAYALDRTKMLAGQAASFIRFTMANPQNLLMPATVVGPTPPGPTDPGIFYTFLDNSFHGVAADRLDFFHFSPDFTTPANSTFTLAQSVPLTSFTYTVCGFFNLNCAPQSGTAQRVDVVSEWPMWQLQYRDLGAGGKKLVGNFTVDAGSDRAGIRWFEVTKSGATYTLTQEGTHAPADTLHRFMGSIGIDRSGGIALGYSTASATTFPSISFASRGASDAAGTLQTESLLFAGAGSQTGSNRWGDYSAMTVDPSDDCTFWYTNQYYQTNSSNSWRTRIASFKLPECVVLPVQLQGFDVD
ncbi:hypothetical protein FBQ97_12155 [Acidobacteria bacterium ACD]|nr:MAG: hypothetical protein EDX89_23960 [Acidobacteriota bacterium]MDL1950550.1 hypothetical protein [Acidobacteria bacterium ACD]